jgi:hypothetical protein
MDFSEIGAMSMTLIAMLPAGSVTSGARARTHTYTHDPWPAGSVTSVARLPSANGTSAEPLRGQIQEEEEEEEEEEDGTQAACR